VRWWPTVPLAGPGLMLGFAALALGAAGDHAWVAAVILGFGAVLSGVRTIEECAAATAMIREAVGRMGSGDA
jgi:hypothetical protein